jgi:hypothetical protein
MLLPISEDVVVAMTVVVEVVNPMEAVVVDIVVGMLVVVNVVDEDVVVVMTVVVEVVNPLEFVVVDIVVGMLVVVNVVEPVELSSCTTTQYRVFTPYREHHIDPVFEKN